MSVEEIPADEISIMTEFLHRSFNSLGCDPMCHCCEKMIPTNDKFKLSTVLDANQLFGEAVYFTKEILLGNTKATSKGYRDFFNEKIREEYKTFDTENYKKIAQRYKLVEKEVMLCEKCTSEDYKNMLISICDKEIARMTAPRKGGCFRVNGVIVI